MAKNYVQRGAKLAAVITNPATPASGDPVRFGNLTGVAILNEGEGGVGATETVTDFDFGVYDLSVKGIDGNGNSAVAKGDALFYVDADTPKISKKSAGYLFGFALEAIDAGATATINVLHVPSPGSGTLGAGTVGEANLADGAVTGAKLAAATVGKGFIPLDITTARLISGDAIQNTTEGGVPDGNTAPALERVNAATDKALRLKYIANGVEEIQLPPFAYPPDLDDAAAVEVHVLAAMAGATDTPVIAVGYFEGVGDTNAGGNTGAVTGVGVAEYSKSIAAGDIGAHPNFANVTLKPAAHANDALYIYAAWIEYTRK